MKPNPKVEFSKGIKPSATLAQALGKNEHIKVLVEEAAEELSSVNVVLKQELAKHESLPKVENAIKKSEAVEGKVQKASGELAVVNRALEGELRDRVMLDHQLAALTEQEEGARHAALHDHLTGLPNRALFHDRLEHGLAQALRHGWNMAVMFLDLDDFKNINDGYGHDVGDAVLRIIAGRLRENTRSDDTISRHGGDEFLYVLMENRDEQDVAAIAQKIIRVIQMPCEIGGGDLNISLCVKASIGIALFPKDGTTADALVNSADKAMYRAKQRKSGYSFVP